MSHVLRRAGGVFAAIHREQIGPPVDLGDLDPRTLEPHEAKARTILAAIRPEERTLEAFPDTARVALGLFSPERQALVYRAVRPELARRLEPLGLWPEGLAIDD